MAQTKVKEGLIDAALGGGVTWDSTAKTADFTAAAGSGYLVDTTNSAITVTLPSSPSIGDEVTLVDYGANAGTNNIIITSSNDIEDSAIDVKIDYNKGSVVLFYSGATKGWLVKSAANETATALAPSTISVDYLVVAGGGGAGTISGGGGAGGLRTSYGSTTGGGGSAESSLGLLVSTPYTVTVGAGGSGGHEGSSTNGLNSVFSTITSTGGGQGGHYTGSAYVAGSSGGSGGGTSLQGSAGGAAVTLPVVQGYAGGSGDGSGPPFSMGGGGGASAVGVNSAGGNTGANGGGGLAVNILNASNATTESVGEVSGTDVYYAGGGGGSGETTGGTGGTGGGGNGGGGTIGTAGSPNTGGGSGGNRAYSAGTNGGSGVVILRYPSGYTITETTSAQLTFNTYTEGSDKVTVFTGGDGTIEFTT